MRLFLVGDVCPTENTAPLFAAGETDALFTDVRSVIARCDYSFVNLECAVTDSENAIKKFGPNLKAPANTVKVLKELGVDCCGLSNNHMFDFGVEGVKDTLAALDEAGIAHTGFGENYADSRKDLVIEKDGQRISLIAVCEHEYSYALEDRMGARPYDEYDTMADIRKAKAISDRVIVIYHGGKELCRYPSPRVRKLCRAMVDNGADVVLCQHSHCIATYENYQGGHILHGQGNFHFVRPFPFDGWHTSLATIYDTRTGEIEFIPLGSGEEEIFVAKGEQRQQQLEEFAARNEELVSGAWKQGWHTFCEENRESYTKAVANAYCQDATPFRNALFAHYLDCEAHTDVWRELFPTYNQTNEKG